MNAEIARMRKLRGYDEVINREPSRIKDNRMDELIVQLNSNMSDLYVAASNGDADIAFFVEMIIGNIYHVLNAFNEMGVYPDYFFDEMLKVQLAYRKLVENDDEIRENYRLFKEMRALARLRIEGAVKNGLDKGYNRIQSHKAKDINNNYLDMVKFFKTNNMPYNIRTKENCYRIFKSIQFNHSLITEELLNKDLLQEDIGCFTRLLFEYLSFFASMGINPKQYLDHYIDSVEKGKSK